MPKIAIDENNNPTASEGKIWFTRKTQVTTPPPDTEFSEKQYQLQFCRAVSHRTNRSHNSGPCCRIVNINHTIIQTCPKVWLDAIDEA